jgi:hypothetical protein
MQGLKYQDFAYNDVEKKFAQIYFVSLQDLHKNKGNSRPIIYKKNREDQFAKYV